MASEVKIVVLKHSTTQLISRVEEKGDTVILEKPVRPVMQQGPNGSVQFMMQPWIPLSSQEKHEISKSDILIMVDALADIANVYINNTSVLKTPSLAEKDVMKRIK